MPYASHRAIAAMAWAYIPLEPLNVPLGSLTAEQELDALVHRLDVRLFWPAAGRDCASPRRRGRGAGPCRWPRCGRSDGPRRIPSGRRPTAPSSARPAPWRRTPPISVPAPGLEQGILGRAAPSLGQVAEQVAGRPALARPHRAGRVGRDPPDRLRVVEAGWGQDVPVGVGRVG